MLRAPEFVAGTQQGEVVLSPFIHADPALARCLGVDANALRSTRLVTLRADQVEELFVAAAAHRCKRQKDKVGKTIVKALYADVIHERADSGLIVTTSELSPGAVKVKRARGYAVEQAHRPKLKEWLAKMRTVGTGDMLSL